MTQTGVTGTDAALEAIEELRAIHGPLAFFQSAGCCDGSLPICLHQGELLPGPGDELIGVVGGMPFYVDAELYRRWGNPPLVLDVYPGAAEGFSLSPCQAHFVTRPPTPGDDRAPACARTGERVAANHAPVRRLAADDR